MLTTSSDSSSGGMWVMVPQVRVSITVLCISRDSPKSATLAVKPWGVSCNSPPASARISHEVSAAVCGRSLNVLTMARKES